MKTSYVARGRIGIYVPDHPHANNRGYVSQSRYIIEQSLGRYLSSEEEVHHKNGDKTDDRIENLEVFSSSEHARLHWEQRKSLGNSFGLFMRRLNYDAIGELLKSGLGYRKIAKELGYSIYSTRHAIRHIRKYNLGSE